MKPNLNFQNMCKCQIGFILDMITRLDKKTAEGITKESFYLGVIEGLKSALALYTDSLEMQENSDKVISIKSNRRKK